MPGHDPAAWAGFAGLVLALLVLDLGVLNRKSHVLSVGEAALWSAGLVATALLFGGVLFVRAGTQPALEYYAGYLVELSLSVDNLFLLLLMFQYFAAAAAGAQVGDLRGDGDAGGVHRGGLAAAGPVFLDHLRLRRGARRHRDPDAARRRGAADRAGAGPDRTEE